MLINCGASQESKIAVRESVPELAVSEPEKTLPGCGGCTTEPARRMNLVHPEFSTHVVHSSRPRPPTGSHAVPLAPMRTIHAWYSAIAAAGLESQTPEPGAPGVPGANVIRLH